MSRLVKSILYNTFYQVLIIVIPFVTLPYLARVLSPNQIGVNGYLMSIIQMMGIITLAGLSQYGVRKIKKIENDKKKININDFLSIYIYQIIIGVGCILIYISLSLIQKEYKMYYWITLPYLVSNSIDISWFFQGIEKIEKIVFRNTVVKLTTVFFIFLLVKSEQNFMLYLSIMSLGTLIGNVLLWLSWKNYIEFEKIEKINLKENKGTLLLLLPQLAIQIYITFDVVLLGIISNTLQVAYYSQVQKIVRIAATIISSISVVMMPRMVSNLKLDNNSIENTLKKSYDYTLFLSFLLFTVIFINIDDFIPWFFGEKYNDMIPILYILSPLIMLIPIGGVFSNQLAIALNRDRDYMIPVLIASCVSIGLNLLLIPRYGASGAAMTSLFVESLVCVLRIFVVKEFFTTKYYVVMVKNISILISTIIIVKLIPMWFIKNIFLLMIIRGFIAVVIYFLFHIVSHNEIFQDFKIIKKNSNDN